MRLRRHWGTGKAQGNGGVDIGENTQAYGREKRIQEQEKRKRRHGKTTQLFKSNGQKEYAKEDKEEFIRGICNEVENSKANNKTRAEYEGIRRTMQTHAPGLGTVKGEEAVFSPNQQRCEKGGKNISTNCTMIPVK